MQNTEKNISISNEAGAHYPGFSRVIHSDLSFLRIILFIGILLISLIIVIG